MGRGFFPSPWLQLQLGQPGAERYARKPSATGLDHQSNDPPLPGDQPGGVFGSQRPGDAGQQCVPRAELPAGAPQGAFGPRLQATVLLLSGQYHLSKRETAEVLEQRIGWKKAANVINLAARSRVEEMQQLVASLLGEGTGG